MIAATSGLGQGTLLAAAVVLMVGAATLATSRRFGVALAIYVLYLGTLDGYLKLGVGGGAVTVLRTVILAAIAAAGLMTIIVRRQRISLPAGSLLVAGVVLVALVEVANPGNPNLVKPIGSLRQEIEFIPLFFLAWATVRSGRDLQLLLLLLVGIAVANGIANFVQFNSSIDQFASWGPGYQARIFGAPGQAAKIFTDASGIGRVRPFGLGTDAGGGGTFGVLAAPATVALILRPQDAGFASAVRVRTIAIAAVPFVVAAVVLSQTRAIVIATIFALTIQVAFTARRQLLPLVLVGSITLLIAGLVIGKLTEGSGASQLSRYGNITPGQLLSTTQRERGGSLAIGLTYATRFPFGAGLGGVGPGTGFRGRVRPDELLNGETQFNVLILDLGVPGLVLVLAFAGKVAFSARHLKRRVSWQAQPQVVALLAGFAGVLLQFVSASPLTGVPSAPFFWGAGGVLLYWLRPSSSGDGTEAATSAEAAACTDHDDPRRLATV